MYSSNYLPYPAIHLNGASFHKDDSAGAQSRFQTQNVSNAIRESLLGAEMSLVPKCLSTEMSLVPKCPRTEMSQGPKCPRTARPRNTLYTVFLKDSVIRNSVIGG